MKPAAFHREADAEFIEALQHFAEISPDLGNRFYDVIDLLITEACQTPGTFRFIRPPTLLPRISLRRHLRRTSRRPLDPAVMHFRRKPGYWQHRLS